MAELKKNQNGGARPGAGRKKGSTNKLRVTDFFNGDERDQLIMEAKILAFGTEDTKPDKDMIKFCWEQLFGKATMKVAGDDTLDSLKLIQIIKNGESDNKPTT